MGKLYTKLPKDVINILAASEGWLVGGSIKSIIDGEIPNDYDIIINQDKWIPMYSVVRDNIQGFNSFGGLRVKINGISIDIWIEELEHFILIANRFDYAYNFRKNILLKKEEISGGE